MELLFESRLDIRNVAGKVYFVQRPAELHPEPVLGPDCFADGTGTSIYGSVLQDGGRFRMWYQGWPKDWTGGDSAWVGYAESDDGLTWRKPSLKLVDHEGLDNNLCDLGFHSPSVFIDPDAPSEKRYRATGCSAARYAGGHIDATVNGYYTAYSSDGLHWELDSTAPTWQSSDVITSVYHPGRRSAQVALKYGPRAHGFRRRSVWTAALKDGRWTDSAAALIPDEFDDVCATARGFASGDYYGMGMLPAGQGIVGFLWHFRHDLPRTRGNGPGVFGAVDVGLVYQTGEGDCWRHAPGRPDFIAHGTVPWTRGGIYTAANVVEVGDEHRLYLTGTPHSHGWYVDAEWKRLDDRMEQLIDGGLARIGFARWPKWRLFGFRADPTGSLEIDLGPIDTPGRLLLNYETESGGSVRTELLSDGEPIEGRSADDSVAATGDAVAGSVAWNDGDLIQPSDGKPVTARLHLETATVYAFDLVADETQQDS